MPGADDPVAGRVAEAIGGGRTAGAAWWVGDLRGAVSSGCRGHAVLEPFVAPLDETTPFDLASLTKPLCTALLAALLERSGALSLGEPAVRFLPELARTPFEGASLVALGRHAAGLPAWAPLFLEGNDRDAYARAVAAREPAGPPGETLYSDLGYVLLGVALERATSRPLDDLFDAMLARPLGLEATGFAGRGVRFADAAATEIGNGYERRLAGSAAAGFAFREGLIRGEVHDCNAWGVGGVAGHAGLFGTAGEVASLARAVIEPGRLGLPADGLRLLVTAEPQEGARTFGFQRACDAPSVRGTLPDEAIGHFGFTGTSVWIVPSTGRVFVLLANRVHPRVPDVDFGDVRRAFHSAAVAAVERERA